MVASGINMTVSLHSTDTRLATAIYLTLTATLGTLGNTLVIVSIVRMKKLGRLYYILIANLNVVALITSVCLIPSHIVNIINSGLVHNNTELCKILGYLNFTLTLEVLLNTSAIAVERCMVVHQTTHNLKRHHGNRKKNITMIVILWIVPAIISTSGFPFIGYHPFMLDCFFVVSRGSFWYILFALSSPAAVSMLIIFVSYFLTLKKVRDSHRKVAAVSLSNQNDKHAKPDSKVPSTTMNFVDKSMGDITKHPEANASFNIQNDDYHAESLTEVAPDDLPFATTKQFGNNMHGTIKPSQPNTSIYTPQHIVVTVNKPESTEMPHNSGYHTKKHLESDASTSIYMEHDPDIAIQSETILSEELPSLGKYGTSDHSEDDTSLYIDTSGHTFDEVAPSKIYQTVPVICLRTPDDEELAMNSDHSNPSVFVGDPREELNSQTDSAINHTLLRPECHKLSKLSVEEKPSCNLCDNKEESKMANVSIMKKEPNSELSKKPLFRSNTKFRLKKNLTKKATSVTNKDKQSVTDRQHLTINNTESVPSISSLISETNMEERELNTEENNRIMTTASVGKYNKHMRRELSITVHLFPVFIIFCFMYLPICLIQAIHVYHPVSPNVWLTFSTLELSFSTLSWVLYGVLNKEFRTAYRNVLCCR